MEMEKVDRLVKEVMDHDNSLEVAQKKAGGFVYLILMVVMVELVALVCVIDWYLSK